MKDNMTIREMQDEIIRLKKVLDFCVLAHSYQRHEITEIADFSGDSFGLSCQAQKTSHKNVLLCGVRFMAETVKILSPDKRVILSHPLAGCPMAEQMDKDLILQMKHALGDIPVVAYINTTAELKTVCDVCVTSSAAVRIISRMPEKELIFIPDINLGTYVASQLPDKKIHLVNGGCPTHVRITEVEAKAAKNTHPHAKLLVHPECRPAVTNLADMVGSTTDIMQYVENDNGKEYIIGTENSIVEHLQYLYPKKLFYTLSKDCVCHNMALTTLPDVLHCLRGEGGEEIEISEHVRNKAVHCINRMLEIGA